MHYAIFKSNANGVWYRSVKVCLKKSRAQWRETKEWNNNPDKYERKKSYYTQLKKVWKKARINHTIQIIRVIQSFSRKEFDPDNPADLQKANELGQELVDTYYPDRQALVCTQIDGKGGYVHNHILINDVSLKDNKGCTNEQYHYKTIRKWTDEIAARYTVLDYGEKSNDDKTHYEKKLEENGLFSYKEEIKKRVTEAMRISVSEEDFLKNLTENGVDATKKPSKKYGDYYLYELVDISEIPEGTKLSNHALNARSYRLGDNYGKQALEEHLASLNSNIDEPKTTKTKEDIAPENAPEMSFKSNKKEEQKEEPAALSQTVSPTYDFVENNYKDIQIALINAKENDKENKVVDNKETIATAPVNDRETETVPTPKPPVNKKKKTLQKEAEHCENRSAQLAGVVYNIITAKDGKDDRQPDSV